VKVLPLTLLDTRANNIKSVKGYIQAEVPLSPSLGTDQWVNKVFKQKARKALYLY
jgi:nicotinamide mononucleotide adenylyltransferase